MKKLSMLSLAMIVNALLQGCGEYRPRRGLDPDTEAEVRRINMENYGGDWLLKGNKGAVYLSLAENDFYWTQEGKDGKVIGGDFGSVQHYLPGRMIPRSYRDDCPDSDTAAWLTMGRDDSGVKLRSKDDPHLEFPLLAIEKRDPIAALPCGDFPR